MLYTNTSAGTGLAPPSSETGAETMSHRTRTLHFIDSLCVGGSERQVIQLVAALSDGGEFEPSLACFRPEGPELAQVRRLGLPLTSWPIPSLRSPRTALRLAAFARWLRRERIEVVHATAPYANSFGIAAARLAGVPAAIASVRDMGSPAMRCEPLERLQRTVCRLAHAVVVNSTAVAGRLRAEGWDGARIEVIANGVAAPPAAAAADGIGQGAGLRAELALPAGAPLVGVICRLHPVKRLGDFVDAAALLAGRHPDARFLIVGPVEGSPVFERVARELIDRIAGHGLADRVILTGGRDDVPRILGELAVSVLPSESEGLSNALIESTIAGVPVVATAVGGNPEVVDDGVTGLLVPPAEPARLAEAIGRLLDSPALAARLGAAGRLRGAARFGLERMVAETSALYRRLLAEAAERSARRRRQPVPLGPVRSEP